MTHEHPMRAWILASLAACSSTSASPPGAGTPTFSAVYANVIAARCTPCHTTPAGEGIALGKLDMTSRDAAYANLVNAPAAGSECVGLGARVVPGDPAASLLHRKVSPAEPRPCGLKMPIGGVLAQAEADAIDAWIAAGAKND